MNNWRQTFLELTKNKAKVIIYIHFGEIVVRLFSGNESEFNIDSTLLVGVFDHTTPIDEVVSEINFTLRQNGYLTEA